jgi:hypothetical protein
MPTDPIEELIPRIIDPKIKFVLNDFASFLDEIINFSAHVLDWCVKKINKGDEFIPVIQSFRHILELSDSISVLVKESCPEPCKMPMRGIFETLLSIEYILEKDTETRGKDFIIWYRHHTLRILRRFDPDDNVYKQYISDLSKDSLISGLKPFVVPDIKAKIAKHCNIFSHPSYIDSENEYQHLKKKNGKAPISWFSMHNGPNNIEELARHLGRPAQYELIYRPFSDYTHGVAIIEGKFEILEPGKVAISQIRLPTDAQFTVQMSASLLLSAMRRLITYFAPDKMPDLSRWYAAEVQAKYLRFSRGSIIEVI